MTDQFEDQYCISCFIKFRVPTGFTDARRASKERFYCPNGHHMVYGENEIDKLRRERDRLAQQIAQRDDEIKRRDDWLRQEQERTAATERQLAAQKANVTKLKKRASGGVCPCCNRTFLALQKHMAQKHPGFACEPTDNVVPMKGARA